MIIAGIDSGSLFTGYGFIDSRGSSLVALEFGAIRMSSSQPHPERIGVIFDRLDALLKKHSPAVLALEDLFIAKNARSALKLGQVRGAIMACAHFNGIRLREFAPTLVKSALTGNGRAEKSQVAFMVTKILGLGAAPTSFDASDALALAITAALRKEVSSDRQA